MPKKIMFLLPVLALSSHATESLQPPLEQGDLPPPQLRRQLTLEELTQLDANPDFKAFVCHPASNSGLDNPQYRKQLIAFAESVLNSQPQEQQK